MFTLSEQERHALFLAGQEKLAREQAEFEAREAEEAANKIYQMGKPETPEQKLRRANSYTSNRWCNEEITLTLEERGGLTESEFNALRPELRLQMYNRAVDQRERAAKR